MSLCHYNRVGQKAVDNFETYLIKERGEREGCDGEGDARGEKGWKEGRDEEWKVARVD